MFVWINIGASYCMGSRDAIGKFVGDNDPKFEQIPTTQGRSKVRMWL